MLTRSQRKLQEQNAALIEAQRATVEAQGATAKDTVLADKLGRDFSLAYRALNVYLDEMNKVSSDKVVCAESPYSLYKWLITTEVFQTINKFFRKYDVLPYGHRQLDQFIHTVYIKAIEFNEEYRHGAWSKAMYQHLLLSDGERLVTLRKVMNMTEYLSSKYILNYSGDDLAINTLKQSLQTR